MSGLLKIELPPGMQRIGTIYQCNGRWYKGNLVCWDVDGPPAVQPIKGWIARTVSAMAGACRAAIAWVANDNTRLLAFGTSSNLYALTQTSDTPVDITPAGFTAGSDDATAGAGYGIGLYGMGTYGTPRVDNATYQEAAMWTLATFGQYLYGIMAADSYLNKWTLDTGTPAAVVSGAPQGSAVVVTPERFIFVLGASGDNRKIAWGDQESDSSWSASATNQAGDFNIETNGKLLCGLKVRGGTLIWTDLDVHIASYIAQPYIYRFDRAGENCGIISRSAAVTTGTVTEWMGNGAFYVFDGVTREIPCDVKDAVFGDFNFTQRSKVVAHHEPKRSEFWWFFPSAASTENDRAVVHNYRGGFWILHEDLSRLSAIPRGVFNNPIMVDAAGIVWDHETGYAYTGIDNPPYVESGPFELGSGDRTMRVRRFIADETTEGDVTVTFYVSDWNNDGEVTKGPYDPSNPRPVKFNGRKVRVRIDGEQATDWRWGAGRFGVMPGPRRGPRT